MFLTMTRSLRCTCTKRSFDKASKSYSSRGLSGISKSACWIPKSVLYFLSWEICFVRTLAYFPNHYRRLSHLRAKYDKSLPKLLSIFTARQHKFSPNVLIWSKYLSIMETTGLYFSIDMCFVLVHCCVGMLMTSCLWGATSILGRKRITFPQPSEMFSRDNEIIIS